MPAHPSPSPPPPEKARPAETPHTRSGDFDIHESFHSRFLESERTLIVFHPPRYDHDESRRYPVLYLHDGQNVFDQATSIGEEWGVDETALELITDGAIEPLIIVGIYNTGVHRVDEYTPTRDRAKKHGGKAGLYGRMLVEEIKPFIDREYRTRTDPRSTGVGGSSLGGLLTVHLGLRYPDVFGKLAALSPSVWWDRNLIVRQVNQLPGKLPLEIWLDAGTGEGEKVVADARELRDALVRKGWVPGQDLLYTEAEGAQHNERSWGARVDSVLRFLFPAAPSPSSAPPAAN